MPIFITFLVLTVVLVLAGKYIFPFIGDVLVGAYHLLVDIVFNMLTTIYALVPGHDFGVALIILTIVVRLLMWPLIKKQLHQTKIMRQLQPELKKIKQRAKGDKQLEARLMMELYRERGVSPFSSIGVLLLQLPILFALYRVIQLITQDTQNIVSHSHEFVRNLGHMQVVSADISKFDENLFGVIDLTQHAITNNKVYVPIMLMAVLAAVFQYFQSKQLMPQPKEKKTLRQLFKEASQGQQADQSDVGAAMSGTMIKVFPLLTFVFAVSIPGALTLYLLTTTLVGWGQQSYILGQDAEEMEAIAGKGSKKTKSIATTEIPAKSAATRAKQAKEAEIVAKPRKKRGAKKKGK